MYATNHYQHRHGEDIAKIWDSRSRRTIVVAVIVATEDYLGQIAKASQDDGRAGSRTMYNRVTVRISDIDLRVPRISRVKLHPDYDIICTGGPMGTHHLPGFTGLPPKLEEYTDEQVQELLVRFVVPMNEIIELRGLEIMLSEDNPDYRNLTID